MPIFNKDLPAFDKPLEGFPKEQEVFKGKVLPDTLQPGVPNLDSDFGQRETGDVQDLFRMNAFQSGPIFGSTLSELSKNKRYDYYKPGVNYEDIYARVQPWYKQIGNGLIKGGAFMVGTFAQSFNSIPETVNAVAKGDLSELSGKDSYVTPIDNWYRNLEDLYPNYYSDYEKAHPFKSILGSGFANTFGDKFVKNLGFMGGAIAGAVVQDFIVGAATQGLGEIPLIANQIGKASLYINKILSAETKVGKALGATEKGILTSFLETGEKLGRTAEQLNRMETLAQAAASRKIGNQFRYGLNLWTSALTESGIESRDGYRTLKNDLIDQYKLDNYGLEPSGKDLKDIDDIATAAMNAREIGNLGILLISNAIQFENILKPFSSARAGVTSPIFQEIAGKRIALQDGLMGGYSEIVPKSILGKIVRDIKPYTPELFTEGVFEEGGQFAIEKGTYDYYNKKYLDQKNNRSRDDVAEFINSIGTGLVDQFRTTAGWENMFLGALTAGLTGKAKSVYSNAKGTGAKAQVAAEINNLNSSQLMGVFENNFENAAQQLAASKSMEAAVKKRDVFEYKNAQFKALFSWANARMQGNRYGLLEEEIKLAKELPNEQFKQMFGFDATADNRQVVNEYLSLVQQEANKIKTNYDKINEFFVNPYKYIRTPKTDEEITESDNYRKYENYKTAMTYFPSLIDHADRRADDIQKELVGINPLLSVDIVKKLGSVESLLDLAKEYEKDASASLDLISDITNPEERKKLENRAKTLRNLAENIYDVTGTYYSIEKGELSKDVLSKKENLPGEYLKLFDNLVNFELGGRDPLNTIKNIKHPLDVEKAISLAVDLNRLDEMRKDAGDAFDILANPEKGFEEFRKVDENRLPPKNASESELTPGREYETEKVGKYRTKKVADGRYQVIGPDKTIVSTHATKEEASATTKYLNENIQNLKKITVIRDNGDGTVRIVDLNGDVQDIPKTDILKYTPLETQDEKIAKQKEQIANEQKELEADSGNVNTGNPAETTGKESALPDIRIMFSSSTTESEGSDDANWQKNAALSPAHIKNAREFLNKAYGLANRANLRAILVTPLLEKTYGLGGLTQISYRLRNEDLATEEQREKFLKETTDVETGFIAQVFVEQVGSDLYFIDKTGNRLGKLGEQLDDTKLGNVVFQTMRTTRVKDEQGGNKIRSNQKDLGAEYLAGWKKVRAQIFATDPNASPTIYEFDISRGKADEGTTPNHVAGTLIAAGPKEERQILKGQSIIQIPTTKTITFKGRAINFPNGRPVLVYGDNAAFLNNIKLDGKRAQVVYAVIEKMAAEITERANAGKKIVFSKTKEAKFLQNVLYWRTGTTTEGSNQINISEDGTTISFAGKSFPIVKLAENKKELIEAISNSYHNTNNKSLSEELFSKSFTEFYIEKGELKSREWANYQSYLLSSTFPDGSKRVAADTPLTTKTNIPTPEVPYTHKQKYSTLIGLEIPVEVIAKPAAAKEAVVEAPKGKFDYNGTKENTTPVLSFGNVSFTVKEGEDPQFLVESEEFKKTQDNLVKKLRQGSPEATEEDLIKQANGVILKVVQKDIDTDLKTAKVGEEVIALPAPQAAPVSDIEAKKADIERRRQEVKEIYKSNPLLAIHVIQNEKKIGSFDDYGKPNGDIQDIVAVLKIPVNNAQDLLKQYLNSGKPEGWKLGDEYDFSKYDAELAALEGTKPAKTKYDPSKTKKRGNLFRAVSEIDESERMTEADIEAFKKWHAEKVPQIPYEILGQMVTINPNRKAWGVFENGVAKFVRGGLKATEYHEVFHGIWRGLLTADERAAIVKEFNAKEGTFKDRLSGKTINFADATEDQVEDRLADDFSDYRKGKVAARSLGDTIREFFKRIMDFFKSFVAKPTLKDQLFDAIEQGRFKDRELSPEVKDLAPTYRAAEGLNEQQTNEFVQDMTALSAAMILGNGKIGSIDKSAIFDVRKITSKQVFDEIKNIYTEQDIFEQFSENTWKDLVEKTKRSLRANLKISFNEEDMVNINDEQTNNRNYAPEPFSLDYKRSAPVGIKFISSTLAKRKSMNQEGRLSLELPELKQKNNLYSIVPYGQVFSTVINKLHNTSVGKIAGKLLNLAQKDADYVSFFQRVGGDLSTGTLPFSNFKYNDWRVFVELVQVYTKQKPDARIEYIQGNQVYSGSALVTGIVNTTVKGWIQNVRNLAKDPDSIIKYDSVSKSYTIEDVSKMKIDSPKEQLEFLGKLGVVFPKDAYDRLSKDIKENKFPTAVSSIKNTLQKDKQIMNVQKKTLDIGGPLNTLAEMLVNATNPIQASTRTNIGGNQTNSFTDSNTPSVFETTFNEVKSIEELFQLRPELQDVFSKGSQVLKLGGIFFNKDGERTKVMLKLGYIEGRNNNDTSSGKSVGNLTEGEKLSLEINQNLNGQFYVMIPADSSTEWMMNLGINVDFSAFETGEAWDKVNEIFKGYLFDDVALALDADNRENLKNVGDRARDLRFFGEILSDKYASAIQEMIDDERSLSDIQTYINENFKDKEETDSVGNKKIVLGIESDIKAFINSSVNETIENLKNTGELSLTDEDLFKYDSLDSNFASRESLNKNKLSEEDITNIITFANTNQIISNFEYHKILFGDPYQFAIKNGQLEETKRIKSFLSPRRITVDLVEFNTFLNGNMNSADGVQLDPKDPGYHTFKSYTKTVTFSDVMVVSELANNPNLPKNVRKAFSHINEGDASSILELGTYREIKIKNDQWPPEAENWYQWQMAYARQNMPGYEYTNPVLEEHDKALIATPEPEFVLEVLKPIVSGVKNNKNRIELVLDKFSQMPIYYKAVQGTSLEKMYLRMINPENQIGYAIMISGRKVGAQKLYDMYKDGMINDTPFSEEDIVEVPWKIYGIQVENSYEGPGFQTRGSQITKIATLDLFAFGEPIGATPERKEAIRAAVNRNNNILSRYHKNKYEGFLKKAGLEDLDDVYRIVDRAALAKALQDEMFRRTLSENVVDSIQLDENGQFIVPFEASPAYIQIRDIIYSFIDKAIGSPKMSGGPYVQVPVTGWENASKGRGLAIKTKDGYKKISREEYEAMEDKKGVVLTEDTLKIYEDANGKRYCEVMIPHWFRDLGKLSKKTDAEIIKYLNTPEGRRILTGVGFRIPTQALSSAEVFVVKGFLPKAMGKTVVVPSAITTKAGSDFDIDKLNMYLKATYIDRNGNLRLVTLEGDEASTRAFYTKVFNDSLAGKQMRKAELLEAVQILSYNLEDPNNLVEKYANTLNRVLEGVTDTSEYEQAIIDEIGELGDENIQKGLREKFVDDMYTKALENEYYESLEELLTLPENFSRLVNPVTDGGLEKLAEKLDDLRGYSEADVKNKLLNRNFLSKQRHAFITGKKWVGIVAVNITGQSLAQKSKIILDPARFDVVKNKDDRKILKTNGGQILLDHNTVEVNGKTYASISGIYDAKGEGYISDGLSGYATAVVDVANNPYILRIVTSDLLISTFMFLRRMGVPNEQLAIFMNQPVIDEYIKLLESKKSKTLFDSRYMGEIGALFPHSKTDITNTFDKDKLEENIRKFYSEGTLTSEGNGEQMAIFREFLKYAKMAEFSFNLTQASNYDTTKFRNAENLSNKQFKQEFAEKYNIFSSVDEMLRNTHIGEQAMYLNKSVDAAAEYLILDRPEFMEITDELMEPYYRDQYLGNDDRNKVGNKMKSALLDFIIQTRTDVATNLYGDLVETSTSVANMLTEAKKQYPNVKIINDLEIDSSGRIGGAQTIKLRVNDRSKDSEDMYTGMMRELRDDPATNALYNGIVKLSILQGTQMSPISIRNIIPVEDYAAKITPIIAGLKADDSIRAFAKSYEFQRNEFADDKVVPIVTPRFREEEQVEYNEDAPRRFQAAFVKIETSAGYIVVPGQFPTIQGLGVKTMQRQLLFLNEKYDAKGSNYDVVKVPRALPINKKKLDEGKIDIATGLEITNQTYAEKIKNGDTSLQNYYGYQKVKNVDGSPVIAGYDRGGNAIYVYKFINLHGDGNYTTEYYGDGRPSVFNNGTQKNIVNINGSKVSGEISDAAIIDYFMENVKPLETPTPSTPQVMTSVFPGVENISKTGLTVQQANEFIDILQPQIEKQAYIENRARTANYMFSFGLRWARNIPNETEKSEQGKNLGKPRPDRKAIKSKEGATYGYYTTDQNNQSLPSIKELQPIIDFIQSKLGIDMSNYDAMLGNIYDDNSFIHQHRDTTESITAKNYPVIVLNLGADGHLEYDKDVKSTYASYKKSGQLDLTNGGIYAFGIDGMNRFTFHHRIGSGLESKNPLKPITLPNGKTLNNYRITLTFRRASDLEIGIPETPNRALVERISSTEKLYSQLGNKTRSENIILPEDLEENTTYSGKDFWSKIVPEARQMFDRKFPNFSPMIVAYRGNSKKSFLQNYKDGFTVGNPFDFAVEQGTRKEQGISSTKKFIEWMLTGNNFGVTNATDEYRQAIINDIKSGKIKNSPILYYQEKQYATHATALDYLINKHNWISVSFESAFPAERQKEIVSNFATKHKMTEEQALEYINNAIADKGQEAIDKLKECY